MADDNSGDQGVAAGGTTEANCLEETVGDEETLDEICKSSLEVEVTHNKRMLEFLKSGEDSDVVFIVGKGRDRVKAHLVILKAAAPIFHSKVCLGKREGDNNDILLPEIEPDSFQHFLKFLYTGKCSATVDDAIPLLHLADIYSVPDLSKLCGALLESSLNETSALTIFQQAVQFNEKNLEETSLQLICKLGFRIIDTPQFLNLGVTHLQKILEKDELEVVSEIQVFEALMRWAKEECKREKTFASPKYCRSVLEKVIPLVRFSQMEPEEFASAMVTHFNILTTEEINYVLLFDNIPMAKWSSLSKGLFNPNPRKYHVPNVECIVKRLDTPTGYLQSADCWCWHYISFRCDAEAVLTSIGLNKEDNYFKYKSYHTIKPFVVEIKVEQTDEFELVDGNILLAEKTETIYAIGNNCQVKFAKPVTILANTWYTAGVRVEGTYYGTNYKHSTASSVIEYLRTESDGGVVKFEFRNSAQAPATSPTTVVGGQMAELGFLIY